MEIVLENDDIIKETEILNLTLNLVDWKPHYILARASLGQIMVSLNKISKVKAKNMYEKILYNKLKILIEELMNGEYGYNKLLQCENINEKNVKFYNLVVNMPSNISIFNEDHGHMKLRNAKIGQLIKASKQRIEYILKRDIPELYQNNEKLLNEFNKMKIDLDNFKNLLEDFEENFVEAIDDAHIAQQNSFN